MILQHVESKVKFDEDGKTRRLDIFRVGNYTVNRLSLLNNMTLEYNSISVRGEGEYTPEIQYDDGFWTHEQPKFTIQTTAYGALDPEEIQKVIDGYTDALEAVKVLTKNFC